MGGAWCGVVFEWRALFGECGAKFAEEDCCALKSFEIVGVEGFESGAYGSCGCGANLLKFFPTSIRERDRACPCIVGIGATFYEMIGHQSVDNPGHRGLCDRLTCSEFTYAEWSAVRQVGKNANCDKGASSIKPTSVRASKTPAVGDEGISEVVQCFLVMFSGLLASIHSVTI